MTLAFNVPPGIGSQLEAEIHNTRDTLDEVEYNLALWGFAPVQKPDFVEPQLNSQLFKALSDGDGRTLTFMHLQFSSWYSYSASIAGQIENRILQIENEMGDIRRTLKRDMIARATNAAEKKPSNEAVADQAHLDARYRQLDVDLQRWKQALNSVEPKKLTHSAGIKLTSRSVEVRRQELESLNGGRAYGPGQQRYPSDGYG